MGRAIANFSFDLYTSGMSVLMEFSIGSITK